MALGLIFTGPVMAASAEDQPITEGVASSETQSTSTGEKTQTSPTEKPSAHTADSQPAQPIQKPESVTPTVAASVEQTQPTETTLQKPITDSSETTKPQNTSVETSVAKPKYHAALWEAAYDLQPKFPQKLIHHGLTDSKDVHQFDSFGVKCGTTYQFDLYADDEQTTNLINKGILNGGDESWPAGETEVYNVFTTAPCPVVVPPAAPNPHAFQLVTCGQDIVTVTNDLGDAKDRLTASFVVYDNGKFLDALVALAGKPTVQSYTFPEDSGVHVITVRTGSAFGDVLMDEKTVESDCKPAVVVPPVVSPTEPPAVTAPVMDTPVTPVTPPKAVLVADKHAEGLAYTGSDPIPLVFGGGMLILLGIVGFAIARKRRTA